ncbi:Wadjet anti-phage system protein JetD domain-containing protein [uncultured Desulfobulbus sp.]|uniref:Wadjet anti-phage system protein JetD domain-containing protein n=1 Tax=uncultured Desulfobulbus sp. TaxID=239745 RepID=UPI0029C7C8D4|nr:Wadjet anti-phage system protein JetD domain-containing protein [uncultured Desulfobulbus sp.]
MFDSNSLQRALHHVIDRHPTAEPFLLRLAERLAKRGTLIGRFKLGDRLSPDVLEAFSALFPNTALVQNPDGSVYLHLDRIGICPEESEIWIDTFCSVMNVERINQHEASAQANRDAALKLDRCRLLYPEMMPIWDSIQTNSAQDQTELLRLADAVQFLTLDHDPLGFAELGARFFENSKALKRNPSLVRRLEEWLLILRDDEITDESRRKVWVDYGVVENATAIKVTLFGPIVYWKNGERFDWIARLHELGETATLSWDNLHGIESFELPANMEVITCENETPFTSLIREGVEGVIVYTAGYPNSAVKKVYRLLPDLMTAFKHWGDTDLDGLRIADMLHRIHPLQLWRCSLRDIQSHRQQLLPLTSSKRSRAAAFLADHPDFPFSEELSYVIENGWLEQEVWQHS